VSSPPGMVATPQTQSSHVGSNLLNVPGLHSAVHHQRSPSFPSSGTSAWTPSPSSALASSDIGEEKSEQRNLIKLDEPEMENNPFAFTPRRLAKLHDPKDLNVLRDMGGLEGLIFGLRTALATGLSPDEDQLCGRITLQDVWHELETRRKQQMQQGIVKKVEELEEEPEKEPEKDMEIQEIDFRTKDKRKDSVGSKRNKSMDSGRLRISSIGTHVPASKGFSDRKRIFSENRLPARKPKGIILLMWQALHDKILVNLFCMLVDSRYFWASRQ
jgi:P-type Ca2+ transporter type 2C